MKKIFYSILLSVFILSCNSQTESDDTVNLSFEKNSRNYAGFIRKLC